MWKRLFHREWRTEDEIETGFIPKNIPVRYTRQVFYGDYTIRLLTLKGDLVSTRRISVSKAARSADVEFTY